MRFLKKQCGFSLVELSVSLAVIGVTMGGALTLATKKTESDKLTETETKMSMIADALDVYLTTNQRLPCPADGSLAVSHASFGVAGTATASSATVGCAGSNFNSAGVYSGVVPTKTLLLADDTMIDGWGRRIDYVVDFNFANNGTTNAVCDGAVTALHKICFKYTTDGTITVNDSTGAARTTTAVYVLISHGKNGRGAWIPTGSATRLAVATDVDELNNSVAADGSGFNTTFVQKDTDTTFDDIVTYRSKAQILDDANAETDSDLCSAAAASATNCVGAPSAGATCISLSNTIGGLCLDM
jgi:prepilin-type N-terminal cleavage/methylation domain-containing protein